MGTLVLQGEIYPHDIYVDQTSLRALKLERHEHWCICKVWPSQGCDQYPIFYVMVVGYSYIFGKEGLLSREKSRENG